MEGWKQLPEELLIIIFRYLKDADLVNASCTCKKWRRVYYDPSLWRSRTFEFRGYCRSQAERLQMLSKYVDTMGVYLQHIRIVCPSPNLLTAYSVAQCLDTVLTGLTSLIDGRQTVQSFVMSDLHFDETWSCFRSSKCLLVDSLSAFLEDQTNLRVFNMANANMTPPFAYRVMRALSKSKSTRKIEFLNVLNYYSEASTRIIGGQLRAVCKKCWNLKEISLNYSYLHSARVVDLCELLADSLEKLNLHVTLMDYSRSWDVISSDIWKAAMNICPRLQVSLHLEGWPRNPSFYLVPRMPLVELTVKGGQCRYSILTFGEKTSLFLDHLAFYFAASLHSASFVAETFVFSPPQMDSLTRFFLKCRSIRTLLFSDTLMTPELMSKVKATLSDALTEITVVPV